MSYGLEIRDENGNVTLDPSSFTMRVVYSAVVTGANAKTYQTISVPGITTTNCAAFVVPIGNYNVSTDMQLETEVIANAVRVYSYMRGREQYSSTTSSTMRLIVIRFS
jgi:predicted SpoU family rRNA methylase